MCTPVHGLSGFSSIEQTESLYTGVHIFTYAPQYRPIWLLYQSRPICLNKPFAPTAWRWLGGNALPPNNYCNHLTSKPYILQKIKTINNYKFSSRSLTRVPDWWLLSTSLPNSQPLNRNPWLMRPESTWTLIPEPYTLNPKPHIIHIDQALESMNHLWTLTL